MDLPVQPVDSEKYKNENFWLSSKQIVKKRAYFEQTSQFGIPVVYVFIAITGCKSCNAVSQGQQGPVDMATFTESHA